MDRDTLIILRDAMEATLSALEYIQGRIDDRDHYYEQTDLDGYIKRLENAMTDLEDAHQLWDEE